MEKTNIMEKKLRSVKSWQKSGQRISEYCREKGIKLSTFCGWVKRYNEGDKKRGGFKEIIIENSEKEAPYCEIKFEGKHKIRIESKESLINLKQMIGYLVSQ